MPRLRAVRRRMEREGRLPRREELAALPIAPEMVAAAEHMARRRRCVRCEHIAICPIEAGPGRPLCNDCYSELMGASLAELAS